MVLQVLETKLEQNMIAFLLHLTIDYEQRFTLMLSDRKHSKAL